MLRCCAEKLAKALPILASLGPRFRTCPPALLTESDTEFAVACVKHVFADYIVLQVRAARVFHTFHNHILITALVLSVTCAMLPVEF